jgi:hypothetical protein
MRAALVLLGVLALGGCASGSYAITSSSEEARKSAEAEQRTADHYRRDGASEAAPQAQARADAKEAEARRKPDNLLDCLFDTLFSSWLASGK